MQRIWRYVFAALILAGCGGGDGALDATTAWYEPALKTDWQIQLQGEPDISYDVKLYILDLFDTPTETIDTLKARNVRLICYFSGGSYEAWRPDAYLFPQEAIGNPLADWEGEWWLDIRNETVREIMLRRLDLAKARGCDGVDVDNVNGYVNDTGFELSGDDQLDYNRFLAQAAHERGLAIGLKNDLLQAAQLADLFDFAVNEECHEFGECDLLAPFVAQGKPVFNIEYHKVFIEDPEALAALCEDASIRGFNTLVLPYELDGSFRISCDDR